MPFSPPPRSSLPRRPQREVFLPPDTRRAAPPPLAPAWFTYSMPASMMPYRVTLDWAAAVPAVASAAAASAIEVIFIGSPL